MKKLLLSIGALACSVSAFSQLIFSVETPASIAGNYTSTSTFQWATDLSVPGVHVHDTVKVAQDSLACNTLANDLTGKIALIYRGTCDFSAKALNAQNAGAVGVIIVNNVATDPFIMTGGSGAADVDIPVVMISQATGAALKAQIEAGNTVVVYMGDKLNYFDNDLGFSIKHVLRADAGAMPSQLAQNGSEFTTTLGGWVFNYGQLDQTDITLNATVNNGSELYNQTSSSFSLVAGDSAFISLPDFSMNSYPLGKYTITYAIQYGNTDEFTGDNSNNSVFHITDTLFALSNLDVNGKPDVTVSTMPAPNENSFSSCMAFANENASRIGVAGMYFASAVNAPDSLNDRQVTIQIQRWDDNFVDLNDENFGFTSITEIATADFDYTNNSNDIQYKAFEQPVILEDGQRYLFCVQTFDTEIFMGYDENASYEQNVSGDLQAFHPIESNGEFKALGFRGGAVPSIAVRIFDAEDLGIGNVKEIPTESFPNPAKDVITVKVNATGDATLNVTDLAGRTVSTQNVKIVNGQFVANVSEFTAGTYVFNLSYSNGASSKFNVVVTK